MAGMLPPQTECCNSCDDPITTQIPGPQGPAGSNGTNGTDGVNAFSTVSSYSPGAQPVVPAELANVTLNVSSSRWMGVGQIVYVENRGYFEVQSRPTTTSVSLKNPEDSSTGVYSGNSAPGTSFTALLGISPGGIQGILTAGSTNLYAGSGSPEGVVTAVVGSLYTDTSTATLYKKVSGSGNTGWA